MPFLPYFLPSFLLAFTESCDGFRLLNLSVLKAPINWLELACKIKLMGSDFWNIFLESLPLLPFFQGRANPLSHCQVLRHSFQVWQQAQTLRHLVKQLPMQDLLGPVFKPNRHFSGPDQFPKLSFFFLVTGPRTFPLWSSNHPGPYLGISSFQHCEMTPQLHLSCCPEDRPMGP